MLSKTSLRELEMPMRFEPPWAWVDENFRDGEWRRSFKIEETRDGDTIVVRAEMPGYGSFRRSIPIPDDVVESNIEATYRDGVLEVRMRSSAEVSVKEPHRVEIKRK